MSLKNNSLVAAAALALGMTVAANASAVCENLLNDFNVTSYGIAEADSKGKVLVLVGITVAGVETVRPVCDAKGDVRIFPSADAAVSLAKKSNLSSATVVRFVKKAQTSVIGDPVLSLKNKHKAFKAEDILAGKSVAMMTTKIGAAVGLGWDTAEGTPEGDEYDDLLARQVSINEWKTFIAARVVTLAAALTAAGINPDTYQPI